MPKIIYFLFLLIVPFKIWTEITHEVLKPSLRDFPRGKATVGTILYTISNKEIYILLGQESFNSRRFDAGKFSDLGGSTNLNQTFLENIKRELYEESCGVLSLTSEEILKGRVFYLNRKKRKNPIDSGRDIFYLAIALKKAIPSAHFMKKRTELSMQKNHSDAFLEKDRFEWVKLKPLLQYQQYLEDGFMTQNIAGHNMRISLRRFFWEDCIQSEDFQQYFQSIDIETI